MGKAIVLDNVSFAGLNYGQVTPIGNVPLSSLAIVGQDSVTGGTEAATYSVNYTPANTYQRGVVWSITSGSEYASIDSATGVLDILPGANNSSVTILATSAYNPLITASKTISVTRASSSDIWDAATDDADFGQYMVGKSKLYEGTNIEKDGTTDGISVTQPITSRSQNFVVLIDVTLGAGGGNEPAVFSRVADNFCMARVSGVWKIGGNWAPTLAMGITESRVTLYIYYDRGSSSIFLKNVTQGTTQTFTSVASGAALRDAMLIGGGAAAANRFVGTIHKMYIGG